MDLQFLLENSARFAYEIRKHFPAGENPVANYRCKEHVVVISNRRLYIFFSEGIIDYRDDLLPLVKVEVKSKEELNILITIKKKEFNVVFNEQKEFNLFLHYYDKYKE